MLLNIYIYINAFYHSWSSYDWSTYLTAILYTLVYFSLNPLHSVRKSHDKYQSVVLIRLALRKKAYVAIQCFLDPLSIVLERVATAGDPLGKLYKRGH